MRWSYTYLDVEGKVLQLLESGVAHCIELLQLNLDYLTSSWLNLAMDRLIAYSPQDGITELQFWLPSAFPEFQSKDYSSIDWSDMYRRAVIVLQNLVPDDMNPWDVYYQYKPSPHPADWIPPFDGTSLRTLKDILLYHVSNVPDRSVYLYV